MSKLGELSRRLKGEKQTLWELIMFYLMGGVTGIVDLAAFALFNYLIFKGLRGTAVSWWLFDYSAADGGLCALLSLACSFAVSQTVNFFLQRRVTFSATTDLLYSGIMYAVMIVIVYIVILWLPTLFSASLCALLGDGWGALAVKLITQFVSALIQFPMNKWVIMRGDVKKNTGTAQKTAP